MRFLTEAQIRELEAEALAREIADIGNIATRMDQKIALMAEWEAHFNV